ncbi:MAG TPA: hypothetical protein VI318_02040 [Baekduia sp.]
MPPETLRLPASRRESAADLARRVAAARLAAARLSAMRTAAATAGSRA